MSSKVSENYPAAAELVPLHGDTTEKFSTQLIGYVRNLRKYAYLLQQLVIVDITNAYKRSFIGLSWLVITPIASVLIWVLLNGAGIMEPGKTDIPYPAYVLLSTSIWSFFQGAYQVTSNVISNSGRFMVTAKFPHEVLVVEQVMVHAINFIIPFFVNILVLLGYGISFSWVALLFPLTLLPLLLLGTGLGLLVALLRVVAVDFSKLADQCVTFLMFLTPIIYAPKINLTLLASIVKYNPLTYLIGFSRNLLTQGTLYEPYYYFVFSLASLVFFFICLRIFMKYEGNLLERLINV
jgi:lipopolysaccharide transport system permease protein